jgi:ATP-dependent helicase/DNAse subunit B
VKEVQYTSKISMEIGNFVHSILEFATKEIIKNNQFNFVWYAKDSFAKESGGRFKSIEVFYIKPILDILENITRISRTRSIFVETQGMQVQMNIKNEIFTITVKPDRVDTLTDSIVIYDYKSGSPSSFTKSSINNLEKIQPIIPAMFLIESTGNLKQFFGNYIFLEHSVKKNITFEIKEEEVQPSVE